jgi:hypothetical protein
MDKFEYKITIFVPGEDNRDIPRDEKLVDYLNDFGVDGWELVHISDGMNGRSRCIFKSKCE